MEQHREVDVHERGLRQVQEPDGGAAVADHHDVLHPPLAEHGVGQHGAGGDGGGAAVDRVDRMHGGEQGVDEPHAADIGREHDLARVEPEAHERLVEAPRDQPVAAPLAVGERAVREEGLLLGVRRHRASRISAGRIMVPSLLTP